MKELEEALIEYYGAISMLREGMTVEVPEKPEALSKLEQCEALGLPLVAGGLLDQPHIWLIEVGVVKTVKQIFDLQAQGEQDGTTV